MKENETEGLYKNQYGMISCICTFFPEEYVWLTEYAADNKMARTQVVRRALRVLMLCEYLANDVEAPQSANSEAKLIKKLAEELKKEGAM